MNTQQKDVVAQLDVFRKTPIKKGGNIFCSATVKIYHVSASVLQDMLPNIIGAYFSIKKNKHAKILFEKVGIKLNIKKFDYDIGSMPSPPFFINRLNITHTNHHVIGKNNQKLIVILTGMDVSPGRYIS